MSFVEGRNMTHQELDMLLKNPEHLTPEMLPRLKELLEHYPYFMPVRVLFQRGLRLSDDVLFEKELARTALYVHDRRWLYFFLYPERQEKRGHKYVRPSNSSGDYFDMLRSVEREGESVDESLKVLAERLKKARMDVVGSVSESTVALTGCLPLQTAGTGGERSSEFSDNRAARADDERMERVKVLVRARKYEEALSILKELNLNNPKKSIYFADQIRFLEKIIDNTKK